MEARNGRNPSLVVRWPYDLGFGLCCPPAQAQNCEPAKATTKYAGLARPVVKVTASPTVPPFTFSDPATMKLTGLETEIIEYVLNCAGVKFEYMLGNWNGGLASLFNGAADIMIGNVNYTAERAAKADFVVFMRNGTSVMVDKGNPKNIRGVDGLCGVTGAVGIASSSRRVTEDLSRTCAQKDRPPINIQLSDGTDLLLTAAAADEAPPMTEISLWDGLLSPNFSSPWSQSGYPAMTVCMGLGENGLPIGVQLGGRPFGEATLLRAAHVLESETRWRDFRPALAGAGPNPLGMPRVT